MEMQHGHTHVFQNDPFPLTLDQMKIAAGENE
jgi:hypothetical protein